MKIPKTKEEMVEILKEAYRAGVDDESEFLHGGFDQWIAKRFPDNYKDNPNIFCPNCESEDTVLFPDNNYGCVDCHHIWKN